MGAGVRVSMLVVDGRPEMLFASCLARPREGYLGRARRGQIGSVFTGLGRRWQSNQNLLLR